MTPLGRRAARLVALLLLAAPAGCSAQSIGTVTGGIIPCNALGISGEPRYAPGSVTVLEGQIHWRGTGPGTSVIVFPATVVVTEWVAVDASYDFVLPPGHYVLRASFPPPATIEPWVAVTLQAGKTEHADIPNMCM